MALIMALDDDRKLLRLMETALQPDGHTLKMFPSGDEAVGWLKDARDLPKLIILDMMMPTIDGHTFLAFLEQSERTRGIPVIIASAHVRLKSDFASDPRIAEFILKPFELASFRASVNKAIAGSQKK